MAQRHHKIKYSLMQDTWDRFKKQSHVNLIVSSSEYTLMNKIFRDSKEPLYGRADSIMKLAPFTTSVLKEILADHCRREESFGSRSKKAI